MKFLNFVFILLVAVNFAFSQDPKYRKYPVEKYGEIPFGELKSQLLFSDDYYPAEQTPGPTCMAFDAEGNFYIFDYWNRRVVKFDSNFLYLGEVSLDEAGFLLPYTGFAEYQPNVMRMEDERITFDTGANNLIVIDGYDKSLIVDFYDSQRPFGFYGNDSFFIENHFFGFMGDGTIISIPNVPYNTDGKADGLLSGDQAIQFYKDIPEITFDTENRVFYNGQLRTVSKKTFVNYHKFRSYTSIALKSKLKELNIRSDYFGGSSLQYAGKDIKDNRYWVTLQGIMVIDAKGFILDYFEYVYHYSSMVPVVHPSGDIYLFDYFDDEASFYMYDYFKENAIINRVENVWDPNARKSWYKQQKRKQRASKKHYGVINSEDIELRTEAEASSEITGRVYTNQKVEILEKVQVSVNRDSMSTNWYKVKTADGAEGWVFGKYLDELKKNGFWERLLGK